MPFHIEHVVNNMCLLLTPDPFAHLHPKPSFVIAALIQQSAFSPKYRGERYELLSDRTTHTEFAPAARSELAVVTLTNVIS